MAELANDLDYFARDIGEFETTLGEIRNLNKNIQGSLGQLNSRWLGGAHEVFMATVAEDAENMEVLIGNMDGILKDLREASREYGNCERDVEGMIKSLKI